MSDKIFNYHDRVDPKALPDLPEIQRMGALVNRMLDWIIERNANRPTRQATSAEQFRTEIREHYMKDREESQKPGRFPMGALVNLNPAEYYAWCLKQDLKRLRSGGKE